MSCTGAIPTPPRRARRAPAVDARGVSLSSGEPEVVELYERALRQFHSYVGDPIATIDEALRRDPRFVAGHLLRAAVLSTAGERRFTERARPSVADAEALIDGANDRERGLAAAIRALVDGEWESACMAFDRVLVEHPRDALAIQTAHLVDFFRGDALNLRNRISRVLPHWTPSVPGCSYVLGMHAFGLEECNQYREAEETGRRALDMEPKDAWAVHAIAHVMEMQGRIDEGIAWLESREPDWAPGNGFAFHNYWHLALYQLDRGCADEALAIFDRRLHAEPPHGLLQLLDATALLWRLHLGGVDVAERASAVAENWSERLDVERGFYAFNDAHAMMAFVMAGHDGRVCQLLRDLQWSAEHAVGANRMMVGEVGIPVCRALRAFGHGDYAEAIDLLAGVRDRACRFGGSHAQRDALTLTLIEAALRDRRPAVARHYTAERIVHKPGSAWGWRLLARAGSSANGWDDHVVD